MGKQPRGRKDYGERFSLHPLTFEQAARTLLQVPSVDEPTNPHPGEMTGRYEGDVEELDRLAARLALNLSAPEPNREEVMDAERIREWIDDEGYRHGR